MSNKRLMTGLLTGGLMVGMHPVVASAAANHDQVTGNARVALPAETVGFAAISISARGGPAGEAARGNLTFRDPVSASDGLATATVECMVVEGNEAVIVGTYKKGARPFGPGFPFALVYVQDNGQPGGPVPDRVFAGAAAFAFPCTPDGISALAGDADPLQQGNVVVEDAH